MAVSVPAITFAQATEPAIDSVSEADTDTVANARPTSGTASTAVGVPAQSNPSEEPVPATAIEVESQRRLNEFRSEYLDDRANTLSRWLDFVAIVLTFFAVAVALAGFLGFRRFREIETEAKNNVEKVRINVETAENLVEEIRETRDESQEVLQSLRNLNAESVAKEPERAHRVSRDAQNNPDSSLLDKAIAHAVVLQQQGKTNNAIEKWRAVAHVAEGSDTDLAARAWFSVGYLSRKNPQESIFANDEAIRLKPDFAEAYNNRGATQYILGNYDAAVSDYDEAILLKPNFAEAYNNRGEAKNKMGEYMAAVVDCDEAIRLRPDLDEAYSNRGTAKGALGLRDEARQDFETALELARNANNTDLLDQAEQSLRDLDATGRS